MDLSDATLPVVVHIVHSGGAENISDAQIQAGISQLNNAFNASFGTGVNTGLEFCLAQRTPTGDATTGITRTFSSLTEMTLETQDLALKNLSRWAPTCYINIWVVKEILSLGSGSGVAGYAYLPSSHGSLVDGIVVEADYFGSSQANTSVLVHEMGHYLGLYHTFQGGCTNNDCLQDGDHVCDTPPDQTTFSSCSPNANSCNTDADDPSAFNPFSTDVPDIGQDYMDYSSLQCYSKFTQGQSDRMAWHLNNVRQSLLGCLSCQTPCPAPVTAQITNPGSPQTVTIGTVLNFSALAANTGTYNWQIGNGPSLSTALNASIPFNSVGQFWVKFQALSEDPTRCLSASDSILITVICNASAVFSVPPLIENGTSATFVNNSVNATQYEWFLDNVSISTDATLQHVFINSGVYQLCLQASNAECSASVCATVNVISSDTLQLGCDNTFIKALENFEISFSSIFPHPNGDFFATGLRNDSMVIIQFDQGGTALWAKAFKFGPEKLVIRDMFLDASGDLIGVVHLEALALGSLRSTAFRYNIASGVFQWIRELSGTFYTQIHSADANNCLLTGLDNGSASQFIMLNKATGAISNYNLRTELGDFYSSVHNGRIYGACRRYVTSFGDFRVGLFSHDLSTGAFQWQNTIISRGSASSSNDTRMYPEKPIIDDNHLMVIASGDLLGFDVYLDGPVDLVLAKTTLLGDVVWTNQYLVSGHNRYVAKAVVPTANGYYLVGNLYDPSIGFNYGLLIKTDKQGVAQWGKRLGISGRNIVQNVIERNGFIYMTMSSDSYNSNELLLLKLDQNGETQTGCEFVQPIQIETVQLPNIQDPRPYQNSIGGPNSIAKSASAFNTVIQSETHCNTACECPEIQFTAGPDALICRGDSAYLHATPGMDSYNWSPTTGMSNPAGADPAAAPNATTTYTLTAKAEGPELIVNGDFSLGNTNFTSDYISGGVGFGHYNVTNNPTLFNGLWSIPLDHSQGPDNLMMMIDGNSSGTTPVVWRQTVQVSPNTDYNFDLWLALAYPVSPPIIQVRINGNIAGTFNALGGDVWQGVWQPYTLNLSSGAATSFLIELRDLNFASGGNDFAFDDISLRTICEYVDSVTVTVNNSSAPPVDLGPDINICASAVHTFDAGAGYEEYLWQDGSTEQTLTAFSIGTYWVTARDSCGNSSTDTVRILLKNAPDLDLGEDVSICAGEEITLEYSSSGSFSTFNWSPSAELSCTVCPSPVASPTSTTTYVLVASTQDGCIASDSVTVNVSPGHSVTEMINRCANEPYVLNGTVYDQPGTYVNTYSTAAGCDSVVTLILTFDALPETSNTVHFCAGETLVINGVAYTESGSAIDTLNATVGCDTIVHYTLIKDPLPTRSETIGLCRGEEVLIAGQTYTAPAVVTVTAPAGANGCDTLVTYTLQWLTPAPSTVEIQCPLNISVAILAGSSPTVVNYNLPLAETDCPCPGVELELLSGLAPGSAFPSGLTTVCYQAQDSCGNTASCCFNVFIREELACDVKVNGCMKYELLNITKDPAFNYTYRIRVTNNCANKMIYTAIQVPNGVIAMEPGPGSVYEAPSGREYQINSPNFSPFYSIRYKSIDDSIANGQSDILKYKLPAQAVPAYIHVTSRLAPQIFIEAHLNTFYCPVGNTPERPAADRNGADQHSSSVQLYPNPSDGELFAVLSGWEGQPVRLKVYDSLGKMVLQQVINEPDGVQLVSLPADSPAGLYIMELSNEAGTQVAKKFVLQK
jgi:hypothetical protein